MHQQLWGEVFHQVNSWRAILNVETEQRVLRAAHDQGMTLKAAAWNLVEHSEKRHSSLYSHEIKIGQKLFLSLYVLRWFLEIYFCNSSTNTTNNDNNNNNNKNKP